jgi:hypothetical protein
MDFKINNKNYIIMKTDYRFWEQNLNPITMQPNEKVRELKEANNIKNERIEREKNSLEHNLMLDGYSQQEIDTKFW